MKPTIVTMIALGALFFGGEIASAHCSPSIVSGCEICTGGHRHCDCRHVTSQVPECSHHPEFAAATSGSLAMDEGTAQCAGVINFLDNLKIQSGDAEAADAFADLSEAERACI